MSCEVFLNVQFCYATEVIAIFIMIDVMVFWAMYKHDNI